MSKSSFQETNNNPESTSQINLTAETITNHLESKIFYEANEIEENPIARTESPKPLDLKQESSNFVEQKLPQDIDDDEEHESPYETIQRSSTIIKNERVSISNIHRRRPKGDDVNSMYVVGDSMVGYKDGVPGTFSPVKVNSKRKDIKSAPVFSDNLNFEPKRPPRKNRIRFPLNQQAKICKYKYG